MYCCCSWPSLTFIAIFASCVPDRGETQADKEVIKIGPPNLNIKKSNVRPPERHTGLEVQGTQN